MSHGRSDTLSIPLLPLSRRDERESPHPEAPEAPVAAVREITEDIVVVEKKPSQMFQYSYKVLKFINRVGHTNNGAIAGVELQMLFAYMFLLTASPMDIPTSARGIFNAIWILLACAYFIDSLFKSIELNAVDAKSTGPKLDELARVAPVSTAIKEEVTTAVEPGQTRAQTYDNLKAFLASKDSAEFLRKATLNIQPYLEELERESFFIRTMTRLRIPLGIIDAIGKSVFGLAALDNYGINTGRFREVHNINNELMAAAGGAVFTFAELASAKAVAKAAPTALIATTKAKIPPWSTQEKIDLLTKYFLAVSKNSCPGLWWARVFVTFLNSINSNFLSNKANAYTLLASACVISLLVSLSVMSQGITQRLRRVRVAAELESITNKPAPVAQCNFFEVIDLRRPKTYWELFRDVLVAAALATKGIYDVSSNANSYENLTGAPLSPLALGIILIVFLVVHTLFYAKERAEAGAERKGNQDFAFALYHQAQNTGATAQGANTGGTGADIGRGVGINPSLVAV